MQIIDPAWPLTRDSFVAAHQGLTVAAMGVRWALQNLLECYDQPLRIDLGGGYFAVSC